MWEKTFSLCFPIYSLFSIWNFSCRTLYWWLSQMGHVPVACWKKAAVDLLFLCIMIVTIFSGAGRWVPGHRRAWGEHGSSGGGWGEGQHPCADVCCTRLWCLCQSRWPCCWAQQTYYIHCHWLSWGLQPGREGHQLSSQEWKVGRLISKLLME